jgi:transcriptional regulator with XRE-family HTH domain
MRANDSQGACILRNARSQAGLSLRELARRAGTSHATVHAYEKGTKTPSTEIFFKVLRACDYAVDVTLSPRIRRVEGLERDVELCAALELAAQFPARHSKVLRYPKFGTRSSK